MSMNISKDSFTFGNINSFERFGIKVIAHDVFSAEKRPRNVQIPFRHGRFDFGEKFFDQKIVRLDCELTTPLTKHEMREVIFWMSRRSSLWLWDEPDKHYIGELIETVDVNVFPKEVSRQFELPLICEPFAFSSQERIPLQRDINLIDYEGTAETPTLIVIRNPNDHAITNLTLTAVQQIIAR
jgi:phage-related protein